MTALPTRFPKGLTLTRVAKALAIANGDRAAANAYIQGQPWLDEAQAIAHNKAAMGANTMADLPATVAGADFSEAVRSETVLPKLPGVRYAPLSVRVLDDLGGGGAAFVAEGAAIPCARMDLTGAEMQPLKVACISILSKEQVRSSRPSAENMVRAELIARCAQGIDLALLDPDNAGVEGVSPASITYGIPQRVSSGSGVAAIYSDLGLMAQDLVAAGSTLTSAAWVVRPATLVSMSGLHDTSGALAFPGLSVLGGTLMGLPVIPAGNLPPPGSPASSFIALIDGSQVVVGDEGQADIAISTTAALQMDDAPSTASVDGTATTMVSLYQAEAVGVRVIRWLNWRLRRPYVSVLSGVTF